MSSPCFLICLNPLAPHITSEMYEIVFGVDIAQESFPECDESKLELDEIDIPVQINGKLRGVIKAKKDATQDEIVQIAKESPEIAKYLTSEPKKIIFIPGKIFNIVV